MNKLMKRRKKASNKKTTWEKSNSDIAIGVSNAFQCDNMLLPRTHTCILCKNSLLF